MKSRGLLFTLAGLAVVIAILVGSYVTNYNYGNRTEKKLTAQYTNMENVLGQYSLKVAEAAQVPGMYRDDLKDVATSVMTARQGGDGSKAMMQWFKEHQINIDSAMYTKIQQIIEGGRNKFENTQTHFINTKATYETNLGYLWKGMWLSFAGYPKIDLDAMKIISSSHAVESFETGIDKGVSLR